MFFKKLFNKDFQYYRDKGEKLLAQQRYAEARDAFQESLRKMPPIFEDCVSVKKHIVGKMAESGNGLGLLNLTEAEFALHQGEIEKAREHIELVMELAEDVTVREKAEKLMHSIHEDNSPQVLLSGKNTCNDCSINVEKVPANSDVSNEDLTTEDRYELMIRTLPEELQERYISLGEKFACAYTMVHDGEMEVARKIYEEMLIVATNDILLYELSIIDYRQNKVEECEKRLRQAIEFNDRNPLCYMGLVHLLVDAGRDSETISLLQLMIEEKIVQDQATFILGEIYSHMGDESQAIESYSQALTFPQVARAAAEKLIPLLENRGCTEEVKYLSTRYLKGCC